MLDIEQKKLEEFKRNVDMQDEKSNDDDADYNFLMSLLTFLRKVPEGRKLFVRTQLQQVFCDEEL